MEKFEGKWLPESNDYKSACLRLSRNLNNFKRDLAYSIFVGNDLRDVQTAQSFYNYILINYSYLLENDNIKRFLVNDRIGNPNTYNFNGVNISPGTLRFMKVLGDILSIDKNIENIIEIGSGYGGQALVIKSFLEDVKYSVVDIPESLALSKSYLSGNGCDVTFIDTDNVVVDNKYDLVISDYCLSELDLVGVKFYVDNIIANCKYGYFTVNSNDELLNMLVTQLNNVFEQVIINKEFPKTSYHDNHLIICKNNKTLND